MILYYIKILQEACASMEGAWDEGGVTTNPGL